VVIRLAFGSRIGLKDSLALPDRQLAEFAEPNIVLPTGEHNGNIGIALADVFAL